MAQYKVPQDVEADDKLLGPFSFRQFIYLLIAGGMIALAFGLFQIFPLLAIIPLPIVFFFAILALPLKKDQPMETYLAALVSFYLKPRKRFWIPGQRESTIQITKPKIIEKPRTRNISEEEAGHRLSFLAEIVDTEGRSIKNPTMNDDIIAESSNMSDIFDNINNLDYKINEEQTIHHNEVINQMRQAIEQAEKIENTDIQKFSDQKTQKPKPDEDPKNQSEKSEKSKKSKNTADIIVKPNNKENTSKKTTNPSIIDLANNKEYSIETIQKEANRINKKDEVYIALR